MLALIAGSGALPAAVAASVAASGGAAPVVCALQGFDPEALTVDLPFRIETLGTLLADLHARGVTEVCLVGAIQRPAVDPGAIDAATMPLVPLLMQAIAAGDDGALRGVIAVFEQAGFTVRSAHKIAPALLPAPGCPTQRQPGEGDQRDAARGQAVIDALALADVGQACAVHNGQVIAVEGLYGTDWMLASLDRRPDVGGGLLFKAPKSGQDRRADLPTIGTETIRAAAAAGLTGVVIEAQGVMVLDQPAVLDACNAAGIYLWVRAPEAE